MHDAFDTDVLIYATTDDHEVGASIRSHLETLDADGESVATGSVILVHELLAKPARSGATEELEMLGAVLARLDLHPCSRTIADRSVDMAARYGLALADAIHLATAIHVGADRFITNNRRDFSKDITEIDVTYPEDLLEPA